MFFRANHEKNELYNEAIKRNSFILRQINNYSKHFQDYLKRKDRPHLTRKNRFIQNKQLQEQNSESCSREKHNYSTKKTSEAGVQDERVFNLQSKLTQLPMLRQKTLKGYQNQNQRRDIKDIDSRKPSYKLKSVFLTINKIHSYKTSLPKRPAEYASSNPSRTNNVFLNKVNNRSIIKPKRQSMKSERFIDEEEVERPPLEIKHYQFKTMKQRIQQSPFIPTIAIHQMGETKTSYLSKFYQHKKGLSEKKSFRVTQIGGKSLKYSKFLQAGNCVQTDGDEFQMKMLNNEQRGLGYQ